MKNNNCSNNYNNNNFDILKNIKLFIFDLDGTLYFKGEKFDKVDELINLLREKNKILRFVTNTDSKSPPSLYKKLKDLNLDIREDELITPVNSLIHFIINNQDKNFYLMTSVDVENYIKDFFINNSFSNSQKNIFFYENLDEAKNARINYVVIGDFADRLDYHFLNEGFRFAYNEAKILALAKFTVFFNKDGVCLNTGAFVKMFENVSKKKAFLLGKPSKYIAKVSLEGLNIKKDEIIIIGDDIDVDIVLAKNISSYSMLLKQGHFIEEKRKEVDKKINKVKPDFIFKSIEELFLKLEKLYE